MSYHDSIVVFGAGSIGRGLIGELAQRGNRPLVFIEKVPEVAKQLQEAESYSVRFVGREESQIRVHGYGVFMPDDREQIARAIGTCSFVATAVGGSQLEMAGKSIAPAIHERDKPLNILVCENRPEADGVLARSLIESGVSSRQFSAIPSSVERMVKAVPNSLDLIAECCESAFMEKGRWLPSGKPLHGLSFCKSLKPYYARKLYTNNAGHALLAYEGFLLGCGSLGEALEYPEIRERLLALLGSSSEMLSLEYGFTPAELDEHIETLVLYRFPNPELADSIQRVARDPLRKLSPGERLVGLLHKLKKYNLSIQPVCRAIAAALHYEDHFNEESVRMQEMIAEQGTDSVLIDVCGLKRDEEAFGIIGEEFNSIKNDQRYKQY